MTDSLNHPANARDIADAAPGLIHGVYVRSDAPAAGDVGPVGLPWPPATVYDLRDPAESQGPHALDDVSTVRHVQILADAAIAELVEKAGTTTLAGMYHEMITGPGASGFAQVVRGIATDPTPVLVHCSAGKDRAGVTAALVLALLGAPRDAIVADYTATAANMPNVLARFLRAMPPEMRAAVEAGGLGSADGSGDGTGPGASAAAANDLLDAPAAAIESVLDAWDAHDGGVEGWYLAHGGDEQTLAALRARLTA